MYNAIEKDESELNNVLVAIPVAVTFLAILIPVVLNLYVHRQVETAVSRRINDARRALDAAREDYSSLSEKSGVQIEEVKAMLFLRTAYLHWNLGDAELASHYAHRAAKTASDAFERSNKDTLLEYFVRDAEESLAYYVAEASLTTAPTIDLARLAKTRGVRMLNELVGGSSEPAVDIERIDTCLFVIWAFHEQIPDAHREKACALYADWALALASHTWKAQQRLNYEKYKQYYADKVRGRGTISS